MPPPKHALHISDDLSLPLDFVVATDGIFATKGMGKSHLAQVIAEEMLAMGQPIVAIDPTDAWWGLRSSSDGLRDGYPVLVVGGDHGDLPIDPDGAKKLAEAIVAERFSCVICTDGLGDTAEAKYVRVFLDTLFRKNREPLHIFIDEADIFAPQKPFEVEDSRCIRAMAHVVRRGRRKGLGTTLITQRPAELNMSVRSQVDMLFILGMAHNLDIEAVEKWLRLRKKKRGDNSSFALQEEMIESLDSLQQGDAWVWAPRMKPSMHQRFRARTKRTFDSGATPKVGEKIREAKRLAPIDIQRLGETIAKAVETAKASDPVELKKRIADLERTIAMKSVSSTVNLDHVAELARVAKDRDEEEKWSDRMEEFVESFTNDIDGALSIFETVLDGPIKLLTDARNRFLTETEDHIMARVKDNTVSRPTPDRVVITKEAWTTLQQRTASRPASGDSGLSKMETAFLTVLAQQARPLPKNKLLVYANYAASGKCSAAFARMLREGWAVDAEVGCLQITAAGVAKLGAYTPLPVGDDLYDKIMDGRVLSPMEKKILGVIKEWASDSPLSKNTILKTAGYAASGKCSAAFAHLVALDYAVKTGTGHLQLAPELVG